MLPSDELDSPLPHSEKLKSSLLSRAHEVYSNNVGLLLITIAQLFSCAMNLCFKLLNSFEPPLNPLEMVSVRMFITYLSCALYMYYNSIPDILFGPTGLRTLWVIRGVAGFCGICFMWFSLTYLPLADAITLSFLMPSATAVVSFLALKERMARTEIAAGFVSLLGVVLIARPRFIFGGYAAEEGVDASQRLLAVGYGTMSVIGGAVAVTCIRSMGTRVHELHPLLAFSLFACVISTLGSLVFRVRWIFVMSVEWVLLFLLVTVFGFITQFLLVAGLRREKAARGMLGMYFQIIFAMLLDYFIFKIQPTMLSLIGTLCITGSGLYVAFTKKKEDTTINEEEEVELLENSPHA